MEEEYSQKDNRRQNNYKGKGGKGGKGGRSGGGSGASHNVQLSKKLSFLLRHGAIKQGLNIRSDGYILLEEILNRKDFSKVTLKDIQAVVDNNDKKRFQLSNIFNEETQKNEIFIRATQGHTIEVNDEELLEEIKDVSEYPIIVHGTYLECLPKILETGLNKMRRNHIHFAIGYPQDKQVISGMRTTCEVFIEVDMAKATKNNIKFYLSKNKVVLSRGIDGVISKDYFSLVKDLEGTILFQNKQEQNVDKTKIEDKKVDEQQEEEKKEE